MKWPPYRNLIGAIDRLRKAGQRLAVRFRDGFWWPPLALVLVATYWYISKQNLPLPTDRSTDKFGQYGDSFGSLTSLFTALGFGGLIITLALQQRQIRNQELAERRNREKGERAHYEDVLFRLLDMYRQTLSEVGGGAYTGRDVLRNAIARVEKSVKEEDVHGLPRDLQGRFNSRSLTEIDRQRIDYLHFRNFKIVSAEINPQGRLLDTFEVLLGHMVFGAPDHFLITTYKDLVFAQITYIECRYYFLVALSITNRIRLRDLMERSGFLDRISRSSIHQLHRQMYEEYWGVAISDRVNPRTIPIPSGRLKRAFRAHKKEVGEPRKTYTPIKVRRAVSTSVASTKTTIKTIGPSMPLDFPEDGDT